LTGDRTRSNARGRLARTGPLENIADVRSAVLRDAGQIGMAGAGTRDRSTARAPGVGRWLCGGAHRVLPVHPIAILNRHRDRSADCFAGPDA